MSFVLWLPDVLSDAGCDVHVMDGAEKRSSRASGFSVNAIVWHHTATGTNWQDGHVAALLRDGRHDLAGPLSQVGIERDGTWVIVAMGRANHNGFGQFGNDSLGLEFYNKGDGIDPWPSRQIESGVIGTAAILNHIGGRPIVGHKESDPRRKVDPRGVNMDTIRDRVARVRNHASQPKPAPPKPAPVSAPTSTTEDELMYLLNLTNTPYCFLVGPGGQIQVLDETGFWLYASQGLSVRYLTPGKPVTDLNGRVLAKDQWDAFVQTQKKLRSAASFGA